MSSVITLQLPSRAYPVSGDAETDQSFVAVQATGSRQPVAASASDWQERLATEMIDVIRDWARRRQGARWTRNLLAASVSAVAVLEPGEPPSRR